MLIDSHCHIPDNRYEKDLDLVVKEAVEEGVTHLVAISTSIEENEETLRTIQKYNNIFASIGVYPHENIKMPLENIYKNLQEQYKKYKNRIVAVGECGIDITENSDYEKRSVEEQVELFKLQLGFAAENELPVIIHNRNGDELILKILEKYKTEKLFGVVHCYTSDWQTAKKFIELGFYISFTAIITYPSASKDLYEVVQNVPADRYLVETDAPYLPPQGRRGEVNYPKYVKITAEKVAEIRKTSFREVSDETFRNTCRLFKLNI